VNTADQGAGIGRRTPIAGAVCETRRLW